MPKQKKVPQKSGLRHRKATTYSLQPCHSKIMKDYRHKKQIKASEKKEWKDATCSVCMEYPHKAVLLLCDSYHKNCRPYMCDTSYHYSNCLNQYKKAYTKVNLAQNDPNISSDTEELLCPLCRGQVKGWTVVKRARKYLNAKKRNCMQENCSFVGSYKDLRKHVRASHPLARPREVEASLVEKWKKLENDSELSDVISTIYSTMPGAVIEGDYVIEDDNRDFSRVRRFGRHRLDTRTRFVPGYSHRRHPIGPWNIGRSYALLPRYGEISQSSEDAGRHVDNRNRWVGSDTHQYISSSADDYESDSSYEDVDDYEGIIYEPERTYSSHSGANQSPSSEELASDDDVIITGSTRNYSSRRGRSQSSSKDGSSSDYADDDGSIEGHVRSDTRRRETRLPYAGSGMRRVWFGGAR